jgi:DNA-binding NarL/FixJ family response regulator
VAAIQVAIVEDNDVFREALEILLGLEADLQVVASARDGRSAVDAAVDRRPDVVVVDYRLPDLDGVETTRAIRQACPEAAVVVLTAAADAPEVDALLDAGAVACLTKDRQLEDIVGTIRAAAGRGAPAA